MPLASSGTISLSQVQTEFGGINPISMSEYYTNAVSGFTSGIIGLPSSGTTVSLSVFRGKAKTQLPIPTEIVVAGATSTTIGTNERCIVFPYSGSGTTKDYTFTTTEDIICDILIVGGGGGGGNDRGGGGGAGGLVFQTGISFNGTINVSVGRGGIASVNDTTTGGNGVQSSFGTIIAMGGGGGGSEQTNANNGGSGGGSAYNYSYSHFGTGDQSTSVSGGYGNRGGDARDLVNPSINRGCGGGGGAGTRGLEATASVGGAGGDGLSGVGSFDFKTYFNLPTNNTIGQYISGENKVYFAGGGGGGDCVDGQPTPSIHGLGGKGGGANGNTSANIRGSVLTSSGGGGGGGNFGLPIGSDGGSGVVIIRYRKSPIPTEIVVTGTTSTTIGTTERCIVFPYSGSGTTKDYTFTTTENLLCDILIVGGGGGGGNYGGGGGGGDVIQKSNVLLNSGTLSISVGTGGAGGVNPYNKGANGTTSSITSLGLFAAGGGGGGGYNQTPTTTPTAGSVVSDNYSSGGGGGGGAGGLAPNNGETGNSVSGNGGSSGSQNKGGGGGGASGNGENATVSGAGNGGAGVSTSISGIVTNYGGGGGGGTWSGGTFGIGVDGGGNGAVEGSGVNPVSGTRGGGGGGGGGSTNTGGIINMNGASGGSGIVILRYRKSPPKLIPTEIVIAGTTSTTIGTTERYIVFPYSGSGTTKDYTFTTTENLICDILVVAGGGGGARRMGGGGGGGGLIYATNMSFGIGDYIIKVGNGGAGSSTAGNIDDASRLTIKRGSNGVDSEIYFQNTSSTPIYRATGGSGGLGGNTGSVTNFPNEFSPLAGGSGGGNGGKDGGAGGLLSTLNIVNGVLVSVINNNASDSVNPSYVGDQCFGNEAGRGGGNDPWLGSGGGGAGSKSVDVHTLGNATANNFAGVGGAGKLINITGSDVAYAGGGGGGNWQSSGGAFYNDGGSGGGGRSGTNTLNPIQGTDGLGGGGGGDGSDVFGGSRGGSGIVIIRYRYYAYLLNNYAPITTGVAVPYSDLCTTVVTSTGQSAYDNLPVVTYGGYNWLLQHNFGTTGRWNGLQLRNFTTGLTIFSNAQLTSQNYTSLPSTTSQIYTDWAPGWSYGSAYGIGGFNNTTNNGPNNIYSNYNTLFQPYFTSLGYSSLTNPGNSSSMIMYIPSWAKQVCLVAADLFRLDNSGSNTRKNSYWWSANGTTWTNLGVASWRGTSSNQYGSDISQNPSSNADMMVFNVSTAGYLLILESGNTISSIAFVLLKP